MNALPKLPYPEFPLHPHRNGQWFQSVWNPRTKKSEQFYFGFPNERLLVEADPLVVEDTHPFPPVRRDDDDLVWYALPAFLIRSIARVLLRTDSPEKVETHVRAPFRLLLRLQKSEDTAEKAPL